MAETSKQRQEPALINYPGFTKSYTRADADRKWLLVDAKGQRVGRLATQVADFLRGKNKPTFTKHDDVGDFVVVINAKDLVFHGNNKAEKKVYALHSEWLGHLRKRPASEMLAKDPELLFWLVVRGMVPGEGNKNRIMKKLKVYAGPDHPHKAQRPEPVKLKTHNAG
jgi:large subunit ribosomal protein L13